MKKILLSVVALMAAMSMNAQVEVCAIDGAAAGATSDGAEIKAGTELGKTASIVCTVTNTDTFKPNDNKTKFKVNDDEFDLNGKGIQGATNGPNSAAAASTPNDAGEYPKVELPSTGCIYHFVPSKDGFLYVIHKGSPNKNYVVFEEKTRVPFIYTMITSSEDKTEFVGGYDLSKIENATEEVEGATYIKDSYAILQPKDYDSKLDHPYTGSDGKTKYNGGNSVIKIPVFEGLNYDVMATGSKMTLGGFVFDTTGDATIVSGETTILDKGNIPSSTSTGINTVKGNVINLNSAIFNAAGQQVSKDYKGLVIKNGRKFIQK